MPSVSKSQQRLMGQAYAYKTGDIKLKDLDPKYAEEIKDLAKSMTKKQLRDFAKTNHKGLPEKKSKKKNESRIMNFDSFVNENILNFYTFEDFTHSDMEMVKELYLDGMTDSKQISIETDLSVATVEQIIQTLKRRGEI
jgi:hypothetical protein